MTDNDRTAQLERACSYLRRIPAWYLATIDVTDGHQPRVRPFSFAMVDDGKLWFCTSRDKDVWAELSANPKFEVSGWKPGECWIVLTGEAAALKGGVAPAAECNAAKRGQRETVADQADYLFWKAL